MNEDDVRALVREAIERHLGRPQQRATGARDPYPAPLTPGPHVSHVLLSVVPGSEMDDGACVIEPAVRCNHCGFCQSYGH